MLQMWLMKNTKSPRPRQVFKSRVGELKPGITENQLEIRINKNRVKNSGKKVRPFLPRASLAIPSNQPSKDSTRTCRRPGIGFTGLVRIKENKTIARIASQLIAIVCGLKVKETSNPGI